MGKFSKMKVGIQSSMLVGYYTLRAKLIDMTRTSFGRLLLAVLCILPWTFVIPATLIPSMGGVTAGKNFMQNIRPSRQTSSVPWDGILNTEWCQPPVEKPLLYENCKFRERMFRIGVHGGLTNALHYILKGTMWAFEEEMCIMVDEEVPKLARLATRAPPEQHVIPFLNRYFEPMGVQKNSEKLGWTIKMKNFLDVGYHQINYHHNSGISGGLLPTDHPHRHRKQTIRSLHLYDKDHIWLKKHMLRRMLRIKEDVRNVSCERLHKHGLTEEYLALSIRRGDKELEFNVLSTVDPYIEKAEDAVRTHFKGIVPTIFVASDDCSVMSELRAARSMWNFVSECDTMETTENGFVMTEVENWTLEQTDEHYQKFITELIALGSAKYFIGVCSTNVAQFVYWMRHYDAGDDSYKFVDSLTSPL